MMALTNIKLSPEQHTVYNKYLQGNNIFITGPGGSGKTALIRLIYGNALSRKKQIAVCALTGCAAQLLECNARTIHSWAGIGLGTETVEFYVKKITKSSFRRKQWQMIQILIIDEISMMSLKLFDLINNIAKEIRNSDLPFGGIQIILSGDFYQLPPVCRPDDAAASTFASKKDNGAKFCFESNEWWNIFNETNSIELKTIFRQTDTRYAEILNQIREGRLKRSAFDALNEQIGKDRPTDLLIRPTKLYPRRDQVDSINTIEMDKLTGDIQSYKMTFIIAIRSVVKTGSNANLVATQAVADLNNLRNKTPKEGAVGPDSFDDYVYNNDYQSQYDSDDFCYELSSIANRLLCDDLVHLKVGAQVMCIINKSFDVWYSPDESLPASPAITVELYNGCQGVVVDFMDDLAFGKCPIVQFHKYAPLKIVMKPHTWESSRIEGLFVRQLPLLLSWAVTIHKSQGATLDYAEIDAGNSIFEDGQTYVALSRVKSLEGLYLSAFDPSRIRTNIKVKEFYQILREKIQIYSQKHTNVRTIVI
jgi:ATP-dependent DNA helicase PIF1